jgi:hypothetical protein
MFGAGRRAREQAVRALEPAVGHRELGVMCGELDGEPGGHAGGRARVAPFLVEAEGALPGRDRARYVVEPADGGPEAFQGLGGLLLGQRGFEGAARLVPGMAPQGFVPLAKAVARAGSGVNLA